MLIKKTSNIVIEDDNGAQLIEIKPLGDGYRLKIREDTPISLSQEDIDALYEALHETVSNF